MFRLNESYARLRRGYKRLIEARPPTEQEIKKAYEVFGLKPGDDLSGLDKLWKELARKNHPDLGGDPEKMKEINWAKDILSNFGTSFSVPRMTRADWDAIYAKHLAINQKIAAGIMSVMNKSAKAYEEHLQKYFPEVKTKDKIDQTDKNNVSIIYKWSNNDGSTAFDLRAISGWGHQRGSASLGAGPTDENYEIMYDTKLYHQGKTYKVSNKRFEFNKISGQLGNPSDVFPDKALKRVADKKRAQSKFQRRDAEAFIKNELGGKSPGSADNWYVPLSDDTALELQRSVMMRMGSWRARFILQKNNAGYYTKTIAHLPYHFIPETEEAFAKIKEFVKELKAGADPKIITRFFPKEG